jgi:hypothetical protein
MRASPESYSNSFSHDITVLPRAPSGQLRIHHTLTGDEVPLATPVPEVESRRISSTLMPTESAAAMMTPVELPAIRSQ